MNEEALKRAILEHAIKPALELIGEDLLGEAQRRAPVEEGTLRGSGTSDVRRTMNGYELEVTFSTPYAARQHEETTWAHPKGGEAKYLENPLKENAHRYAGIIAMFVRRQTK